MKQQVTSLQTTKRIYPTAFALDRRSQISLTPSGLSLMD
jgi:hypothetical protein